MSLGNNFNRQASAPLQYEVADTCCKVAITGSRPARGPVACQMHRRAVVICTSDALDRCACRVVQQHDGVSLLTTHIFVMGTEKELLLRQVVFRHQVAVLKLPLSRCNA